jgi:4-hydroxy-tetrahydrodipicolinate reductase
MTIKILVNGAFGRMGQEVVKTIKQDSAFELVAEAGIDDDLQQMIKKSNAQVVVDFTSPEVGYENTLKIINSNAHPVIGTTGFKAEQIAELKKVCDAKNKGGIIAPNFSIGAVLTMQFSKQAARFFPDVEIIEMHHPGKLDAPSGTAIKTAEIIAEQRQKKSSAQQPLREIITGSRGALHHDIPIHAVRLPGLVACEEVIFGGTAETLTIRHDTIHREAFMPGVILACKEVVKLKTLVYGLEHLFQ